ncbi:MAG: hypothetical protein JXQ76_05930 [Campylobacterales bacterium]|nr:hypothetical protein [Campylobacterales bacterium]
MTNKQLQNIASDILSRVTTLEAQTQALTDITGESKEHQGVSHLFFGVVEELQRIQELANKLETLVYSPVTQN